jgi:tetratricopeptide (TPR) repeat protein
MRRLAGIIALLWLLSSWVAAESGDGGTESVFNLGAGARAMGMGNGFVGLADDATAVYYNPAGLPFLQSQQVTFLHTLLFEGTIYDFMAYVYPYKGTQGFGIAAMRLGTDDIGRRDLVTDLGQFDASQMQVILSYGRRISSRLSAGASLKLAHQGIDELSAYGYGCDLAARFAIFKHLHAGVQLQDLVGARLKLLSAKERTPFTLKTGLAYQRQLGNSPISGALTFDLDKPENRSAKIRTGFEIVHKAGLALRTGYDRDNFAFGMGIHYQNISFDYAYKFINKLTDSHRFSLTVDFGRTHEEEAARQKALESESGQQYVSQSRRQSLLKELEKADRYYAKGQLDSALAAYYRADAFAEDKTYINGQIAELQKAIQERQKSETSKPVVDTASRQPMDIIQQATELYLEGALIAARDLASVAHNYYPNSPSLDTLDGNIQSAIRAAIRVNLAKAENAMSRADYITAYDGYNTVLQYEPDNAAARDGSKRAEKSLNMVQHLSLGLDYFNQEKYMSAQREFKTVLQLDPSNRVASEYLGRIDERVKESTTLEDLQKDDHIWQIYLNGLEAFRQGNYQMAIDLWEQVLEVYPHNKNTLENIAQARLRLKK